MANTNIDPKVLAVIGCVAAVVLAAYAMGVFSPARAPAWQPAEPAGPQGTEGAGNVEGQNDADDTTVQEGATGGETAQAAGSGGAPAAVEPQTPRELCQSLCRERLSAGADLSSGPCLSNSVAPGWVCDVAHSPRAPVDNIAANQCSAFGKTASHFVEVGPDCAFIKEV